MSEAIITVEGLGKKYSLRHQSGERYTALRDVVAEAASRPFRSIRSKFGKQKAENGNGSSDFSSRLSTFSFSRTEEFWALRDINFEVRRGEVLGIIGRNGAGKSTLLKILSRITDPTEGRIKTKGRVASLLEVGTGFHPELTGRENIYLNGAILGMTKAEIKAKFDEIVTFAEVEKFLDTPVKRYSSGMYVRLAFAVAAHLEPEILIIDEVLAVGDAEFQKKCLGKMDDVAHQGRTVLVVSHQMGVIAGLCRRALLLEQGHTVASGGPQAVIRQYLSISQEANGSFEREMIPGRNQLISVRTETSDGAFAATFAFSDYIHLAIRFTVPISTPQLQLGVGLENALRLRVFTVVREVGSFGRPNADGVYLVCLQLPTRLIAPNHYSFTIALFQLRGAVQDHLQNVCPIQILDDGTALSAFEGVDYGCVIVNGSWARMSE